MKKHFDNFIIGLYYILLILSFFALVIELPYFLNEMFNTKMFNNTQLLFFIICGAIYFYAYERLEYRKQEKLDEERMNMLKNRDNEE